MFCTDWLSSFGLRFAHSSILLHVSSTQAVNAQALILSTPLHRLLVNFYKYYQKTREKTFSQTKYFFLSRDDSQPSVCLLGNAHRAKFADSFSVGDASKRRLIMRRLNRIHVHIHEKPGYGIFFFSLSFQSFPGFSLSLKNRIHSSSPSSVPDTGSILFVGVNVIP